MEDFLPKPSDPIDDERFIARERTALKYLAARGAKSVRDLAPLEMIGFYEELARS
jgi:hypothetical protein